MAEETVSLPDSPEVYRSWRRISTRKLSFLYTEENILPNYLRSTSSSCHDVCKYGRKHHEKPPTTVSPLKRVNRSFSGSLSFDSPLRKKKKKALTKSVLMNSSLDDSGKKTKKTVSHSFKTIGASRRIELEMVEHNKRVTALKLKSVAQTAAMALRRSVTVNRKKKKTNGGSEAQEPTKEATMYSKRCSRSMKTKKESNVPLDLVEEKTLYVIKMGTGNDDDTVESDDQNKRCVMDSHNDDPKSQREEDECIVTEDDDESSQEEEDENKPHSENKKNTPRQGKRKSLSVNGKSVRLRFKRGKFSDIASQDNNSPRKLKFKRGKIVTVAADTTTKSVVGGRSLKTKGSNDKEQEEKARSFKVFLKHQEDRPKKRDSRVLLFNKVIKKTAKVKALVGAFESVISLQERKRSSPTVYNTSK